MAVRSGALLTFWERPGIRRIHGGSHPRHILTLEAGRRRARIGMGAGNAPRPPRSRGEGRARSCVPGSLDPPKPAAQTCVTTSALLECLRAHPRALAHTWGTLPERPQNAARTLPDRSRIAPRSRSDRSQIKSDFKSEGPKLQIGMHKASDGKP